MKSTRILLTGMVISINLAASLPLLHAQTAGAGSFNSNLSLVPAPVQDDIVLIMADAAGLQQSDPASLPRSGTYWAVTGNGDILPYPCPPQNNLTVPFFKMAPSEWLVDLSGGALPTNSRRFGIQAQTAGSTAVSPLETEATMLADLILRVQNYAVSQQLGMRSLAMDSGGPMPGGGGGGGGGTNDVLFTIDYASLTNGLWLEMTNLSNGYAWLNLHNATDAGGVYEIFSKNSLSDAVWNIEGALWPSDTNCQPFVLSFNPQSPNYFVWARDWTGVTSGGNQTPEWWFWTYFGTTALLDSTLDANSNSLLSDFTNNVAPAVFSFSGVQVANNYVSTTPTTVQLNVTGSPYYVAVLVDDPNFNDAVWTNYTSPNVTVSLWPQGWHDIWIGLRGHADAASAAVWQWKRLKLDYTPPSLVITGPASGTVNVPVIQLTGYSPEALGSISYDLNNAAGTVTNQQILVLDQSYSTDTWEFTTNTFQAFDVPLTNGVNTITLHATDLAGNTSTLATNFTLDYSSKTNPPTVQLYWPPDGTLISCSNYTWRGHVDDPTATITAQLVDTNGGTNMFNGIVERNGNFWVENLPLSSGSNWLTLTATDAAGNSTNISITVFPGAVALTISMPSSDQLWNHGLTVDGTISDPNDYTVWVNGVKANYTGGTGWEATNVYLPEGGTALIQARAIPNADNGGNGTGGSGGGPVNYDNLGNPDPPQDNDAESQEDRSPRLYVKSYTENTDTTGYLRWDGYDGAGVDQDLFISNYTNNDNEHWVDGVGGGGGESGQGVYQSFYYGVAANFSKQSLITNSWPASFWPVLINGTYHASGDCNWDVLDTNGPTGPPSIVWEHCNIECPNISIIGPDGSEGLVYYQTNDWTTKRKADATIQLQTGGKAGSHRQNLFRISGSATNSSGQSIPAQTISINGKTLGGDGNLWAVLPDNSPPIDVTPLVQNNDCFTFNVQQQEYYLVSRCKAALQDLARTNVGVGEVVDLYFSTNVPYNNIPFPASASLGAPVFWNTTAGSVWPVINTNGRGTHFISPSNAAIATVTATVGGATVGNIFNVLEPSGVDHAVFSNYFYYPFTTRAGAGVLLRPYIGPTSVSFYRVQIMEVGEDASDVQGYFLIIAPPSHIGNGADTWINLGYDNHWLPDPNGKDTDWAESYGWFPPWFGSTPIPYSGGQYTWDIPAKWRVGTGPDHPMANGWNQIMTLYPDGTMTVTKFGHTVSRTINNQYSFQ